MLGRHIAGELQKRGAVVVLAGRDPDRLLANAAALGPDTRSIIFDFNEPTHAPHVVTTAATMMGGLDGIINAAGVVAFGGLESLTDATLDELVAADLTGPLRVMRSALPILGGGFFVNITGVVAEQPVAGMAAYSAVKAGLSAATTALGRELRRHKIQVLDARPPHTETGLADRPIDGEPPRFPQGLLPEHVARVIVVGLVNGAREIPAAMFASES